jgi:hypothetical protein
MPVVVDRARNRELVIVEDLLMNISLKKEIVS